MISSGQICLHEKLFVQHVSLGFLGFSFKSTSASNISIIDANENEGKIEF